MDAKYKPRYFARPILCMSKKKSEAKWLLFNKRRYGAPRSDTDGMMYFWGTDIINIRHLFHFNPPIFHLLPTSSFSSLLLFLLSHVIHTADTTTSSGRSIIKPPIQPSPTQAALICCPLTDSLRRKKKKKSVLVPTSCGAARHILTNELAGRRKKGTHQSHQAENCCVNSWRLQMQKVAPRRIQSPSHFALPSPSKGTCAWYDSTPSIRLAALVSMPRAIEALSWKDALFDARQASIGPLAHWQGRFWEQTWNYCCFDTHTLKHPTKG